MKKIFASMIMFLIISSNFSYSQNFNEFYSFTVFYDDFDDNKKNDLNVQQVYNTFFNNKEFNIVYQNNESVENKINKISLQKYFFLGFTNLATHYTPNKNYYTDLERDFISPGFEILLGYHFGNRMKLSTGLNYQFLFFNTNLKKNETNRPENIKSALMRNLSIPFLMRYNLIGLNNDVHLYGTSGLYYSIPLFAQYTENRKISGGGGYSAGSITYTLSDNFYYTYLSLGFSKEIHYRYDVYIESFFCNQLFENFSNETRNPYWIGIKTGINFSLKKETNEK